MIDYTKSREVIEIIDSTLLRADVVDADIEKLCNDAKEFEFAAVIVNPLHVKKARKLLRGSPVKVGTVIAFPLGEEFTNVKVVQVKKAIRAGAQDVDVVAPISQIKQGNWEYIAKEIKKIKKAARGKTVKMIIETGLLTREEIIKMTELCVQGGIRFIKTGTGYQSPADAESVKLIIRTIKATQRSESALGVDKDQNIVEVKASGGIKTLEQALEFYDLGVKRIGTSSAAKIAKQASLYFKAEDAVREDNSQTSQEKAEDSQDLAKDFQKEVEEVTEPEESEVQNQENEQSEAVQDEIKEPDIQE